MSNLTISTALQNLLNVINDPAGKAAITQTLLNSPSLLAMYNNLAIGAGGAKLLTKIDWDPSADDGAGSFDPNTGVLHMGLGWVQNSSGAIDPDKLAYLMGHEGWHDANASVTGAADASFNSAVQKLANSGGNNHDYTQILLADQQAHLQDEGQADISGWNTMVQEKTAVLGGPLTPKQLAALAADNNYGFYDSQGNLKAGFVSDPANPGQILPTNSSNILTAAAQYGTYMPSIAGANATYTEYYADSSLRQIISAENGKTFTLDFTALKLNTIPNSTSLLTTDQAIDLMVSGGFISSSLNAQFTIINKADNSSSTFAVSGGQINVTVTSALNGVTSTDQRSYVGNTLTQSMVSTDTNGDGKLDQISTKTYGTSGGSSTPGLLTDVSTTFNYQAETQTTTTINYHPNDGVNACTVDTKTTSLTTGVLQSESQTLIANDGSKKNIFDTDGNGNPDEIDSYNAAGQLTGAAIYNQQGRETGDAQFNSTGQQTDWLVFDPTTNQETQDRQLNSNGTSKDWIDYSNGVKTDQIDFQNNQEVDQKFFNSTGGMTGEALFNASLQETDWLSFNSAGQEIQDRQFNSNGTSKDWVDYSNGVKSDQIDFQNNQEVDEKFFSATGQISGEALFNSALQQTDWLSFNSAGQETQDRQLNAATGAVNDWIDYSNGVKVDQVDFQNSREVDEKFFNSAGGLSGEALFNAALQQTDWLSFNAQGQISQDQQLNSNGTSKDWIDYSNGVKTDQIDFQNNQEVDQKFFNTAGQLTNEALFNASLQETDWLIFNGNGTEQDQQLSVTTGKIQDAIDFNSAGQKVDQLNLNAGGAITDEMFFNASGQKTNDAVFNGAGQQTDNLIYNTANGQLMQDQQINISTGQVQAAIDYNSAGQKIDQLNLNSAGQLTDEVYFSSSGSVSSDVYVNTGFDGYSGGIDYSSFSFDFGGFGLSGTQAAANPTLNTQSISNLVQTDLAAGNLAAASAVEASMRQAYQQSTSKGSTSAVLEGVKWGGNPTVTWSMASLAGTAVAPFSAYMDSTYEKTIQNAFTAWSKATGLTFKEMSDSSNVDIRLGWGNFDTAHTGILGYTSFQASNTGQISANEIVRLENPGQDAFVTGSDGQAQTYSGTQATLYQTLLHEIGHALGFGSDADPSSIMYYQLTANNRTLDATDVMGGLTLYQGASAATAANIAQLVQSIAALAPAPVSGASTLSTPVSSATTALLATAH